VLHQHNNNNNDERDNKASERVRQQSERECQDNNNNNNMCLWSALSSTPGTLALGLLKEPSEYGVHLLFACLGMRDITTASARTQPMPQAALGEKDGKSRRYIEEDHSL
jgi:hypothetical protein